MEKIIDTVAPASDHCGCNCKVNCIYFFVLYFAQHVLESKVSSINMIPVLVTSINQCMFMSMHENEVFGLYKTISNLALDLNVSSDGAH